MSLLTLKKQTELIEKYGGLAKAFEGVRDINSLCELLWCLIDKNIYRKDYKLFCSEIKVQFMKDSKPIIDAIFECQEKSMPKNTNSKIKKELARINNTKEENPVCYGEIYDVFAKRYGYTLENFYGLTTGQIHGLLKVIDKKTYDELSVKAKLHGVKMKARINYNDDFSDEESDKHDKEALDFLKEAREEYQEKMKNG